jgi:hypothetical protein
MFEADMTIPAAPFVGVTPAFYLDLPKALHLRSLTLNPAFADDDDSDRVSRALAATAFVRERRVEVRSLAPIVWFEAQVSTTEEQKEVRGLAVYASREFELSLSKLRNLRSEISRSSPRRTLAASASTYD